MGGSRGQNTRSPDAAESGLAQHAPALRAVAAVLCRNAQESDDLVQDTFVRALRHLSGDHDPVRNVRAWLVAILRNVFIDGRRAEHDTTSDVDDCEAPEPDPQPAWADVNLADVRAACEELDPMLRAVFELHYLDGLPYREIASRQGVPENTVASRLFRARKALRDRLIAKLRGRPS